MSHSFTEVKGIRGVIEVCFYRSFPYKGVCVTISISR